jgi:hypothetical protein
MFRAIAYIQLSTGLEEELLDFRSSLVVEPKV